MKKALVFGIVSAFAMVACGGGSSSGPSYSEMKQKFDNPTGAVTGENASSVGSALASQEQGGNVPMALSKALKAVEHVESAASDAGIDCSSAESQMQGYTGGDATFDCTCNGGGTVSYTIDPTAMQNAENGYSIAYSYNNCTIKEGTNTIIYNGSGSVARSSSSSNDFYYSFHGTVSENGEATQIDVEYYMDQDGKVWFLVTVDNGTYVCNGSYDAETGNGEWEVKDSTGTWSCTSTAFHGSCTSGSDTVTF